MWQQHLRIGRLSYTTLPLSLLSIESYFVHTSFTWRDWVFCPETRPEGNHSTQIARHIDLDHRQAFPGISEHNSCESHVRWHCSAPYTFQWCRIERGRFLSPQGFAKGWRNIIPCYCLVLEWSDEADHHPGKCFHSLVLSVYSVRRNICLKYEDSAVPLLLRIADDWKISTNENSRRCIAKHDTCSVIKCISKIPTT